MRRRFSLASAPYILFAVCLLMVISFSASGEETTSTILWQEAAKAYKRQQYDSALSKYLEIERRGQQAPELNYNIGNCYYRLGQTGEAVYFYRKAYLHDPLNTNIETNIALAEKRIIQPLNSVNSVFFIKWWKSLTAKISPVVWAWLLLVLWISLWSLLYLKFRKSIQIPFMNRWLSLNVILIGLMALLFYFGYQARYHSPLAVVMEDTPLESTTAQEKESSGLVPEGTTVSIKREQEGYYEVRLPNGGSGWITRHAIRKLIED